MSFKSVDREKTVQAILKRASKNTDSQYHPSFSQVEKRAPAFAIGDRSLQKQLENSNERLKISHIEGALDTDGSALLKGLVGALANQSPRQEIKLDNKSSQPLSPKRT